MTLADQMEATVKLDGPDTNASDVLGPGFPVCEPLRVRGCKHCVSLFLLESGVDTRPTPQHDNATMTLVEYEGRVYGITCKHVIDAVDNKNREAGRERFDLFTVVNRLVFVGKSRFVQPARDVVADNAPDVAIRQLHPDYARAIGKQPLVFQALPPWDQISHGIAVGYPTGIKTCADCGRVEIPCVHALSEKVTHSESRVQLFSVLDHDPGIESFSGMSGGPIFWSSKDSYGLLGIMFEAAKPKETGLIAEPRINILGEIVSPERLTLWLSQTPRLY